MIFDIVGCGLLLLRLVVALQDGGKKRKNRQGKGARERYKAKKTARVAGAAAGASAGGSVLGEERRGEGAAAQPCPAGRLRARGKEGENWSSRPVLMAF